MPSIFEVYANLFATELENLQQVGPEEAQVLGRIFLLIYQKCGRAWIDNCLSQIDLIPMDTVQTIDSVGVEIERGQADKPS